MKKKISFCSLIIGMILLAATVKSQVTWLSNTGGNPTDYLGWDATNGFALNIKHLGNEPIQFWTNDTMRMYINYTNFPFSGYVGIGRYFMHPQQLLHLNQWNSDSVFIQWTNSTTDSGATNGYTTGIASYGTAIIINI